MEIGTDVTILQVKVKRERFKQGCQQVPWVLKALQGEVGEQRGVISFTEYSMRCQDSKVQKEIEVEEKVIEQVTSVEDSDGRRISQTVSHQVVTEETTTTRSMIMIFFQT